MSMMDSIEEEYFDIIEQLKAENKRLRKALQWWIDVNPGAPNKYQWAKNALKG